MTTDVHMETAQWTYELMMGGLSGVCIDAITKQLGDEPSRWHPIRRAEWNGAWRALFALANATQAEKVEQEAASDSMS